MFLSCREVRRVIIVIQFPNDYNNNGMVYIVLHNWNNEDGKMLSIFQIVCLYHPSPFAFLLGAKILRHIRDVLNEDVRLLFYFTFYFLWLLIIHQTRAVFLLLTA